jgi:pimeloyl-ACP methyl ester carboxylesterase
MNRLLKGAMWGGILFGVPALVNTAIYKLSSTPDSPLFGEEHLWEWTWGRVHYRVKGQGKPLLLVHGVYAGASDYEWRENFDILARHYRVYAIDLLGFGASEKPDISYTANLYTRLLEDFVREIISEPTYILASSLSSAFAVTAARRLNGTDGVGVEKLALVCPTGIHHLSKSAGAVGKLAGTVLNVPILGTTLYNKITSMADIRTYLREMVYADESRVTQDIVEHAHAEAHQEGSEFAARAFISGRLNTNIASDFASLNIPVLLLWGWYGKTTPVTDANDFLDRNPHARLHIFEQSGLLPHEEEATEFNSVVRSFLHVTAPVMAVTAAEQSRKTTF